MAKVKTSKKQKKSEMKFLKAHVPFKSTELKDPHLVVDVLFDCLRIGDIETFREVLCAHLMTMNKTAVARKTGLGRQTLYDLMDPKREFNPELSTLTAIIQAISAA